MTEPKPTEAEIQTVFDAITECMFAPHELPLADDLATRYRETARHALVRLAAARSPAPEWRPIDQAPKDGTFIFAVGDENMPRLSYWGHITDDIYRWIAVGGSWWSPKYWMPKSALPSPPKETT